MSEAFTIKVFFRGDWCPWCSAYLTDFNNALPGITNLGGSVVAITAQADNQSKANLDLNYDVQIDESNTEANKYGIFITPKDQSPLADVDGVYPSGMAQPGVIIENAVGDVLFKWAINPDKMNFGGATDRPLVADIVLSLQSILQGKSIDGNSLSKTNIEYLADNHPAEHEKVQAYLASLKKQ